MIYRAGLGASIQLDSDEIQAALSEWIAQTSMLIVDGSPLQVDRTCPLILSSFDDPVCGSTSDEAPASSKNIVPILAGVISSVIIGAVVITIVIVVLVVKFRGKTDKIRCV